VLLGTVRNELKVFERLLRRALAFKKVNTLNQIKFSKPMSGRLRKISMPTRIQEIFIQEGRMTRYQYCLWPLYISTNNRHFLTLFIALFIEFVYDRPRLLVGTVVGSLLYLT
jgi:hypothetical protein